MSGTVTGIRIGVSTQEQYNDSERRVDVSHEATYCVVMDADTYREPDVLAVAGVPWIGYPSPIYPAAKCIGRTVTELALAVFEVKADFANTSKSDPDDQTPPEDRSPVWSWGFETLEEPLLTDARDVTIAIRNSAGEPLPPITQPNAIPVLTIERYKTSFDYNEVFDYVNTLNQSAFWGASANTCLLAGITATPEQFESGDLWKVVYTIKFKRGTNPWKAKLLDEGLFYWSGGSFGSGQKTPFGDDAFQQVVGNLDGSGGENATSTPAFVEYERYDEKDWAPLDLGPNW